MGITLLTTAFIAFSLLTILLGGLPFLPRALASEEVRFSIRLSLVSSTLSTLLCFLTALPCAYAMTHCALPFRRVCRFLLELPLSLPFLVLGLCMLMVFSTDAGRFLRDHGLRIIFDPKGVVVAQWIVNIPFVIRLMRTAFGDVDKRMEFVAALLGASRWQLFWTITLPLCRNALLMAAILTWSRAIGEFGATLMLVGVTRMKTETLPASIYLNITTGENGMAMASAIILLFLSGLTLLCSSLAMHRQTGRFEGKDISS